MRIPTPTRASLLAKSGTYLTTKGVRPEDDPRRPALSGLSLDGNALSIAGQVCEVLRRAGYTRPERDAYFTVATLGDRTRFLGVTHQWCSLTGGSYSETVMNDEGESEEVEVFVCGLCNLREVDHIHSECMGCGWCHDCCDCDDDFYEDED